MDAPQSAPAPPSSAETLDGARMTPRYWAVFGVLCAAAVLEFFDLYVVGFLVSAVAPEWGLTFSQVALILVAAGLGAIVGGGLGGGLADRFGRKTVMLGALSLISLASASAGLLPHGAWATFAALRFLVGIAQGAMTTSLVALTVEWTPLRHRTMLATLQGMFGALGVLMASGLAAGVLQTLGWRGLALLGILPLVSAVLILIVMPESPRWLLSRGRVEAARKAALRVFGVELQPEPERPPPPAVRLAELFTHRRRMLLIVGGWVCYSTLQTCLLTWGPTLISPVLNISPAAAAGMFIYVSLGSIAGGLIFALIANAIGRSATLRLGFYLSAVLITAAAFAGGRMLMGVSIFVACLTLAVLLLSGVASNLGPYSGELFPARLVGRGAGLGQAASGLGKFAGPALLAVIAGSGNLVTPHATVDAIVPTFLTLAGLAVAAAILFSVIRIETHGRTLQITGLEGASG